MDALQIFKNSWRITWQHWRLWLITFLMLITFIPSMAISISFSTLVHSIYFPPDFLERVNPLYSMPERLLTILSFTGLAIMVVCLSLSWTLQAAAMRITAKAVEGEKLTLRKAFNLGRDRFINIVKISLVFGLIIAGLAYLPVFLFFMAPPGTPAEILFRLIQPIISPLNIVLNFVILLLLMAIALDKSSAQDSLGRAWDVFKSGWVRFIIVIIGTSMLSILLTLLVIPLVLIIAIMYFMGAAQILLAAAAIIFTPIIVGMLLFNGVFSLVLFTVTYRASSDEGTRDLKAVEVYGI